MTLTGNETNYYIARKNSNNGEDTLLRMNNYSGLFSSVEDFESASKFETFEEVKKLVQLQNMLSTLMSQPYDYYAIQHDVDSFRLDEDGNIVEDVEVEPEPEEEEVIEEPTE